MQTFQEVWKSPTCKCIKWLFLVLGLAVLGSYIFEILGPYFSNVPLRHTLTFAATSVAQIEAERLLFDKTDVDRVDQYKSVAVTTTGVGLGEAIFGFAYAPLRAIGGMLGASLSRKVYANPKDPMNAGKKFATETPWWKVSIFGCLGYFGLFNESSHQPLRSGWFGSGWSLTKYLPSWLHSGKLVEVSAGPLLTKSRQYNPLYLANEMACGREAMAADSDELLAATRGEELDKSTWSWWNPCDWWNKWCTIGVSVAVVLVAGVWYYRKRKRNRYLY